MNSRGVDVTEQFVRGSRKTIELVASIGATCAVLKAKSPSCGIYGVYDGTFSGTLVPGMGTCACMLADVGLLIVDEIASEMLV